MISNPDFDPDDFTRCFVKVTRGTMTEAHGTRFITIRDDCAVAELDFSPALAQVTGRFHAGAIIALADEACTALASFHAMKGKWDMARFPLTIQLSSNLVANVSDGTIVAHAYPEHLGRRTLAIGCRVSSKLGRLVALVTATLMVPVPKSQD